MFFNMTQDNKRAAVEWDRYDRISGLPRDVMYHILELLPAQDAQELVFCPENGEIFGPCFHIWCWIRSSAENY
ncbi:hypothetical protein P3S68_017639 [Capsicum galapagoense]